MALQFEWKCTIPTEDIIKDVLPDISQTEMKSIIEKVGTVWEMFTVGIGSFSWE